MLGNKDANYVVRQGDCISSIAHRHGLFWEKVWNHPENAELKKQRKDPNILFPGDSVFVPEREQKEYSAATESRNRFRRKGVPAKFKVCLAINDEPLANKRYRMCINGKWQTGTTDGGGFVEAPITPDAKSAKIMVEQPEGTSWMVFEFKFGSVDPIDTEEGIRERLINMGYDAQTDLAAALRAFQRKEGLPETGKIDDATTAKVREKFGQ